MYICVCVHVWNPVPPEFSDEQPDMVQVVEDETATLPVKVSANPDAVTCEWIFQGEKLVKGNRQQSTTYKPYPHGSPKRTRVNTRRHMRSE